MISKFLISTAALISINVFARSDSFKAGRFGTVRVFNADKKLGGQIVLLFSDEKGWDAADTKTAESFGERGHVVVGVDLAIYLNGLHHSHEKCLYPAADLESLSHLVQKKYGFTDYLLPSLVGDGVGAALAYGVLAQSPDNTFSGAASVGFCNTLPLERPLCGGSGLKSTPLGKTKGYEIQPDAKLNSNWFVLRGKNAKACAGLNLDKFIAATTNAKIVDFEGNLSDPLRKIVGNLKQPVHAGAADAKALELPIVEVESGNPSTQDTLVVIVSGDGGWASLDKDLSQAFTAAGFAVVGLDSLKYFWNAKTPDQVGTDLTKISSHYLEKWKKKKLLWIGYSMGADVLPFGVSRLPVSLKKKSVASVFLGLSQNAEFEFHVANWLSADSSVEGPSTKFEIEKNLSMTNLCIRGDSESESGCDVLKPPVKIFRFPGGHHFGGDYKKIADLILKEI